MTSAGGSSMASKSRVRSPYSTISWYFLALRSSVPLLSMAEALLTRISMPPNSATAASTIFSFALSSMISTWRAIALRAPASSHSLAAVKMVPGSVGCGSAVFAAMIMLAPSAAARFAMARPMPREPPVTSIVRPASERAAAAMMFAGRDAIVCQPRRRRPHQVP